MRVIELHIQVETDLRRCRPDVRAFVDLEPHRHLMSETEVPLQSSPGANCWCGAIMVPVARKEFFYRLGISAHESAAWSLTIIERRGSTVLLADSDILSASKTWFVGTCMTPVSRKLGDGRG